MPIIFRTEGRTQYGLRSRASGADASGLMLVHVTAVGAAREILRAGQITVRRCKVFSRDLTYFFVLRPAYKLRDGHEKRELIDFFPFVFLVDPAFLGAPFHVYPFDTGGAFAGAFDAGHSPWLPLQDYALEETLQGAADHMAWAFDTRADYFDGRLKPGLDSLRIACAPLPAPPGRARPAGRDAGHLRATVRGSEARPDATKLSPRSNDAAARQWSALSGRSILIALHDTLGLAPASQALGLVTVEDVDRKSRRWEPCR